MLFLDIQVYSVIIVHGTLNGNVFGTYFTMCINNSIMHIMIFFLFVFFFLHLDLLLVD